VIVFLGSSGGDPEGEAVAVMVGMSHPVGPDRNVERERLVGFRQRLYGCFGARADALFELGDAVLCAGGPVTSLVELCREKPFRRGHGALYDGLACGQLDSVAVGRLLACSWDPVDAGPVKVAVDVSTWARPDAETSPGRCHCYHSCRCDGARKTIPGWPYSIAAGLSWGASSRPRRWMRCVWVPTTTPPSPACSRSSGCTTT